MSYRSRLLRAGAVICICLAAVHTAEAFGTSGAESPRHALVIPQFRGPAELGTDLSEAPWNRAARTSGLMVLNARQLADHPTHIYACYDDSALWLAYRCEGLDGRRVKVEATERDGRVWWDDAVEFYCSPDHSRIYFSQFAANAAGVMYDGKNTDGKWNADWQVVSSTDETGFTVAMRIPFEALEQSLPAVGQSWRVNFSRHGPTSGASSWVWAYNGFHDPRQFGELIFGGPEVKPARLTDAAPWAIGKNSIQLDEVSGLICRLVGLDRRGTQVWQVDSRPASNRFNFMLEDDGVRTIEAHLRDRSGQTLARWWSDVRTPELTPGLTDWSRRMESMEKAASRLPAGLRAQAKRLLNRHRLNLQKAREIASGKQAYSSESWDRLADILKLFESEMGDLSNYVLTLEHLPEAPFAVGFESPMRKVMIRDFPFEGWFAGQARVSLARNETEALQLVVMPVGRAFRNVRVSAEMSGQHDAAASEAQISCKVSLVGHVDVGDDPPYEAEYKEFWPDPLLSFLQSADIKAGEHVAFWIDVISDKSTPAGEHQGVITVEADGCKPTTIPLTVQVWDFELPDGTHLKNAFTYHRAQIGGIHKEAWNGDMERAYEDLILERRLGIDHLYRRQPPDINTIKRAVAKGMNCFNIVFAGSGGVKKHVLEALETFVPQVREAGLLDLAYVYGFDEIRGDKYEDARKVFEGVKQRYPGIPTMTTAQDTSFGKDSGLREAVDIWVPLTPSYDMVAAEELRREGKQMWWYVCLVPTHPYANWFVEYPAIESRLLMGAMSYKYQVDGFLYYLVNNGWERNKKVITGGPYTDWDPASCENSKGKWANGDGNLIYPGSEGPLSSIRLENIRDGLEDYEYLWLLAERVEAVKALPATLARKAFLSSASELLAVPDTVVRNVVEYTRDPQELDRWRAKIAELIVKSANLSR